ncbi:MAG: tetratricopeptide repeat protein [Myxococcales bacterium]
MVSLCAAFLPLADHLGYELAELIALFAGLFGAAPGIAASRAEATRPAPDALRAVVGGLSTAIALLLVPVAIILLNGLRRPACEPLAGLVLYGLVAVPSGILAATMGALCGFVRPRGAGLLAFSVFLLTLGTAIWPVVRGPQVYVYDHLAGMFPGPIYDEVIRPTPALYLFRLGTLLYAGMCAGLALFFGPGRRRRMGLTVAIACGAGAIAVSSQAETFHFRASTSLLDRELGGVLDAGHVVLHFPREKTAAERALLAHDAEVSWRAVREFAGLPVDGAKVDVFLYRNPEEKRRLIGAAETSFTKPWLRQVHTNDAPAPHPILRHELAHAAFADLSPGVFGVPGRLRGLVPDMALVEGAAVAADWPPGEFTLDEEARALRELKLLPDPRRLFRPGLFYAESGPRAYTVAGSFVRFVFRKGGPAAFRAAYSTGEVEVDALADAYLGWLSAEPAPPRAVALAQQRFASPSIVRRTCAHEVAELRHEGGSALAAGDPARAATLYSRCVALEPGDPALLADLHRAQLRAGETAAARATEQLALSHPKLSEPLRATLLTGSGDAAWAVSDVATARERFTAALGLVQPEPAERALRARLWALADSRRGNVLRRLLAEADAGPETVLGLKELADAEPAEGLPPYLLAKQLQNRGAWEGCLRYATAALSRRLPHPLFVEEALRMEGIAAWHLGDAARGRSAFAELGKGARPGRALEAKRWLDLF